MPFQKHVPKPVGLALAAGGWASLVTKGVAARAEVRNLASEVHVRPRQKSTSRLQRLRAQLAVKRGAIGCAGTGISRCRIHRRATGRRGDRSRAAQGSAGQPQRACSSLEAGRGTESLSSRRLWRVGRLFNQHPRAHGGLVFSRAEESYARPPGRASGEGHPTPCDQCCYSRDPLMRWSRLALTCGRASSVGGPGQAEGVAKCSRRAVSCSKVRLSPGIALATLTTHQKLRTLAHPGRCPSPCALLSTAVVPRRVFRDTGHRCPRGAAEDGRPHPPAVPAPLVRHQRPV